MIHNTQLKHLLSNTVHVIEGTMPVTYEFPCEVIVDGLLVTGRTVELTEGSMNIVLPIPLFARLDSTTIILTQPDGSSVKKVGRVTRQEQIGVGEVLIVIALANRPANARALPPDHHDRALSVGMDPALEQHSQTRDLLHWARLLTSPSGVSRHDRRLIPRLTIHAACTMLTKDMIQTGVTTDLSYTGFSVQFSDFTPDYRGSAVFYIKFVKLKATPIGLTYQGRYTIVRFRVDSIQEGKSRWRDMHYSYWQHLS